MKTKSTITGLFFCVLSLAETIVFAQQIDYSKLAGSYFGQKPPGVKAELFAPGIISNNVHDSPTFSPDGNEIIIDAKYYRMRDGVWLPPEDLPFKLPGLCNGTFFSPSGERIYILVWTNNEEIFL
jgi:hypothetical protein